MKNQVFKLLNMTFGKYLRFRTQLLDYGKSKKQHLYPVLEQRALVETAVFCEKFMKNAVYFPKRNYIFDFTIDLLQDSNFPIHVVEFGVWKGESINYLAKRMPYAKFLGFDTFTGLPEHWVGTHTTKGYFSLNGNLPKCLSNVTLIAGLFTEVCEKSFISSQIPSIDLIHIDCDLYSSTKDALESVSKYIKKGSLIIFDEYFGYPNWKEGEYKAFSEYTQVNNLQFEYLAFSTRQVLLRIV